MGMKMNKLQRQGNPSIAKITRPIPTGVLPRERLFDKLDNSLKRPVVWVSGIAGCGKTTLISSYLETRKLPCIWYQIDEGDADLSTFFYYMGLAAKKVAPKRKPLPLLAPEYLLGLSTFTLRYFENLFAFLKPPFAVVLDNCERVPEDSPFYDMVHWGLGVIPEGMNVIVNSRRQPPAQFAPLQAGEKIGFLAWEDIRFTLDESREVIQAKGPQTLTEEVVRKIHEKTEGWAAGLILMIEAARIKAIDFAAVKETTLEEIYNYFETELFDKINKETRTFLLKTAFLPEMTAEMAKALTGTSQSKEILQALTKNNFFVQCHSVGNSIYQYHSLFREYLISRSRKDFSEDELSHIKLRAAALLADSGNYEEAAALFLQDGAWAEMVQLIVTQAQSLVIQGRLSILYGWLMGLPGELREKNPWLLFWMGMSRLPFDPLASEAHFSRAFELFTAQQDPAGMLLAWSGAVNAIGYSFERFSRFDSWTAIMEKLKPIYNAFPVQEIKTRVAASMVTALTYWQPWHPELEVWANDVFSCPDDQIDVNIKIQTLCWFFYYQAITGKLRDAHASLDLLKPMRKRPDASYLSKITSYAIETICNQLYGLHDECLKAAEHGLALAGTTGIHVLDHYLIGHAATSCLNRGDLVGARNFLKRTDVSLNVANQWGDAYYYWIRGRLAMIEGNSADALNFIMLSLKLNENVGVIFALGCMHASIAQVLLGPGKEREVEYHLRKAYRIADQAENTTIKFYALYVEVRLALLRKDMHRCLRKLRELLALGKEEMQLATSFDDPSVTAQLCALALEHGIEVDYVREIIRRRRLTLDPPPLHIEQWPWQFRVYTMGRFELHNNGGTVQFSRKAQKKPLELLKTLIASGGKEVSEEQIVDLLWPESDGDAAYDALKTNLSRLRHILDNDKAIRFQDGRIALDPQSCWVDAWAFEHMAAQSERLWKQNQTEAIIVAEKALDLYQGHFLSSDRDTFWIITYQERLRDKYLRLITRAGDHHKKLSQWEEALDYYLKGLEIDSLIEEFYQQIMVCYGKLGQPSRAIETYHRCKKILASSLGCNPSSKTESLYQSLKTG
jgi:LuxR family transcriptional regulator, maltose regulon positive regulatory protein